MNTETCQNDSYVFIPFEFQNLPEKSMGKGDMYKGTAQLQYLIDLIKKTGKWDPMTDDIKYMFRFVTQKLACEDEKRRLCFHFKLNDESMYSYGIWERDGKAQKFYPVEKLQYKKEPFNFAFTIKDVQLYCFNTQVGIIAFHLQYDIDDPFQIAAAQYYMKKISKFAFQLKGMETTLLKLARKIMAGVDPADEENGFSYFYFANAGEERANFLTYLETEKKDNYLKELYYLKRCYKENFKYSDENDSVTKADKIHYNQSYNIWGLSSEAAVCLVVPEENRDFVETFRCNFNRMYLFMFVFLLHQKYTLYLFLTKIDNNIYNNLDQLEEYRERLCRFESDFVYSNITEVPQYQSLYESMSEAFSLRNMYEDVHEPIESLSEIRRADSESNREEAERNVNRALIILSLLSVCSALIDSYDFIESFFGARSILSEQEILFAQNVFSALIIVLLILIILYMFINQVRNRKIK